MNKVASKRKSKKYTAGYYKKICPVKLKLAQENTKHAT